MNEIVESFIVLDSNIAYRFDEKIKLNETDYKMMKSDNYNYFFDCMKVEYNGRLELVYKVGMMNSIEKILPFINPKIFLTIIEELLQSIVELQDDGLLSCCNIVSDFGKIYVDQKSYKIKFIYIPISEKLTSSTMTFIEKIRRNIIEIIDNNIELQDENTLHIKELLSNTSLPLRNILERIKNDEYRSLLFDYSTVGMEETENKKMKLVGSENAMGVVITVNKNEFIIGKNKTVVDFPISFNKLVSRVHCKITNKSGQFYITDLESANGTYINGKRIEADVPHLINNADEITLANSSFYVVKE
jgi:hypothetical protein